MRTPVVEIGDSSCITMTESGRVSSPYPDHVGVSDFSRNFVHVFTKKNPSSPAETFNDGMIPIVKLSFITMTANNTPSTKLTTNALTVSWLCHGGTSLLSKIFSTVPA